MPVIRGPAALAQPNMPCSNMPWDLWAQSIGGVWWGHICGHEVSGASLRSHQVPDLSPSPTIVL